MAQGSKAQLSLSRVLIAFVSTAAMLAARGAHAQEPEAAPPPVSASTSAPAPVGPGGFGAPGVWVFTFETADNGYGSAFFHKTSDGPTTIQLNPGVDYFLAPNVSVGGNLFFSHSTGSGNNVGVGARVGYNLALVDNVGFWPTARFFLIHYGGSTPSTATSFGVLAPFIWHATTHFFLGGGPDLNVALSGGSSTEYGLDFILGGWL
ncbi:MAG TPA: hypothetical protein VLT58_14700 [Polyangia bacterium]|nr:hypothetical protein [Polyangia bacterium]